MVFDDEFHGLGIHLDKISFKDMLYVDFYDSNLFTHNKQNITPKYNQIENIGKNIKVVYLTKVDGHNTLEIVTKNGKPCT